ncbi:hypothetical protein ASG39_06505 [Rhizobium sp. Leaf371]|nr:hypothetical protein ASG39_06505 [Rhizobium sp. Leaf371]
MRAILDPPGKRPDRSTSPPDVTFPFSWTYAAAVTAKAVEGAESDMPIPVQIMGTSFQMTGRLSHRRGMRGQSGNDFSTKDNYPRKKTAIAAPVTSAFVKGKQRSKLWDGL